MGRAYHFECGKCGYRAKVAGRPDRGLDFFIQTILCRDCKELYDAVTRLRIAGAHKSLMLGKHLTMGRHKHTVRVTKRPPKFEVLLGRLPHSFLHASRWVSFQPQCPVSVLHRIRPWTDPDKCPRCGVFLDKSATPYRIWE